jgi:hypothetical protein
MRARIILTEHDPLAGIANLRKEKTIVFDGGVIHCDGRLDTTDL